MSVVREGGKIIISEMCMEEEQRTIPAAAVGGTAGGVKYIYHGILFKFANDVYSIYGGDGNAQKCTLVRRCLLGGE